MERLDQRYLTDVAARAKTLDVNAFAELYAVVFPRVYEYLSYLVALDSRTEGRALRKETEEMLTAVMAHAFRSLPTLVNPELFLPWICRICCRECEERMPAAGEEAARAAGILQLPLTESQILRMRDIQHLSEKKIEEILNLSRGQVRKSIRNGRKHMRRGTGPQPAGEQTPARGQASAGGRVSARRRRRHSEAPDGLAAARILEAVFDECDVEPNTIPLEALASYAVYRKERFSLQRGVLGGLLALFFLMPALFLMPGMAVSVEENGLRGLPVYTIRVSSLLPVNSVTARQRGHRLPVYEADAKIFTIEPTRNGEMAVEVELVNRQKISENVNVTEVDAVGPVLTGSDINGEHVRLVVEDTGIGVDYAEIYALSSSGEVIFPISVRKDDGEVIFDWPEEDWDVYIPDHIGNMLHLALTLNETG